MKIWDAQTGAEVLSLKGADQCVVFSPDGKRLASGTRPPNVAGPPGVGRVVKVWDAQTGQELLSCKGHTGGVTSVAFSPDGKRLASASRDQTVKVWDAQTGQELLTLAGYSGYIGGDNTVAFSPDGHWLASGAAGGTVKIWDATPLREKP